MPPAKLDSPVLRLYAWALCLYPRSFRDRFAAQLLQTARDWYAESSASAGSRRRFCFGLAADLFGSLLAQHTHCLWRPSMKRSVVIYSSVLFVLLACLCVGSAMFDHSLMRATANQPQQQMAERYAELLSGGASFEATLPSGHVDMAHDLDPFVLAYDDSGHPVGGNGFLNDAQPAPPAGVFAQAREHGHDMLTWKPQQGTRIALVVERVTGAHPGFLLAGRSLSSTERNEHQVYTFAAHGLLLLFVLIAVTAILLIRASSRSSNGGGPLPA